MAMASRRIRKATVAVAVAVVFLLGIELAARLFGEPVLARDRQFVEAPEWSYPDQIARDTELLWRYRPNQVIRQPFFAPGDYAINSHGLRGADFRDEKTAGVVRVVCLGGSTTFGWGVPENAAYPRQLEIKLNELDPQRRRWEVINAGVTDYSTHQGLALARRVLPRWQPDVVLFDFSWGDLQPAGLGIPDQEIAMPPAWRLGLENLILRSAALQHARKFLYGEPADRGNASLPAYNIWRVDPTSFIANGEKLIHSATDIGARAIWVTSPIAWPPPGQSDTGGVFHYHHRYHRAGVYAAALAGAEIAELANNFNLYRDFFDNPAADFEHFNADGHNFAGDYLARFILGLPLKRDAPSRSGPDESADQ
jgi:hypothetical protein